ncbi:4-hydroxy-3-methylbut-2-enyl diphosphate reductase [Caminibacter pacificus]|uniref:4-hydroxy-3-methylbut-2-enyl diphosphate reductase n=1 Tax=Caminibacter pacificus TaxID=1424653 RepID=A0AAJ4UYE0_9BACT|nr:4-hydroxy-3-methylbut-2-enyl diphosphate reductase [Caminibacter pacificus]NPA87905.1 4-hydroxy-3-methylbut-2-enyl diphosphate reductase [Campylobacterota bacterium]QCI28411.1 4-hydroxy-3-methylbut-2-enyl diphosphate reductase [Caminibacter pacificus]ROR40865.1 4-hydroxy-3-methylbut-2-enyl diphosphate reductase [Caminibacter pacificus]
MKIEKAKSYGFCFGVRRAVEIAENSQNAVTLGPLIHNPLEIQRLAENYNVKYVNNIDEIDENIKRVIVRTHGIPKDKLQKLKEKNVEVIDATCPFVKKPQEIVEEMSKQGYDIVIFGDKNHPEIKGVMSYAVHDRVYVVLTPDELKDKRLREKIATVAQTTRKLSDYLKITNYLIENYKEVRVFNTICNATFENQDAVRELSKRADIMIIVGGKNSSNTKQLYNIAKENCESYLIESEDELNPEWFKNKKLCGISAGASTPEWLVEKIISKIKEMT